MAWEDRLRELRAYKKRFGNCNVPAGWPQNKSLARWVDHHRQARKHGAVSEKRVQRLDKLGFEWTPHVTVWHKRLEELSDYHQRFGDCNVPQEWRENPQVGRWVAAQRRARRQGRMTDERIGSLDSLGFEWEPGRGSA
jgi:hypothetical protein